MCWRMSGSVRIGMYVPCSIERSRSGNGAHVWIFFEQPLPASKARRLGNAILTEATERYGRMTFKSYDRFFPNQDRLPDGGFGNLVALPLQGKARKERNSVFVDEDFMAYGDQWNYLLEIKRISEATVDAILTKHEKGYPLPVKQNLGKHPYLKRLPIMIFLPVSFSYAPIYCTSPCKDFQQRP